ncbi:MAG: glutathione S-transferase family protein [Pseudomonadota bacterium]
MLALYHSPYSTCSQKVRLCLAEKGLDYEKRDVDLARQEHLTEAYLALNPNGVVPTLVHDDAVVIDSSVICEYLDEVFPETPLSPASAAGRADMRAWMRYSEEVPTTAIRPPSFNKIFAKRLANLPDMTLNELADRMPLRKGFYRRMRGEDGFDDETMRDSLERLGGTLDRMERRLEAGPWLMGDRFTIADIVVIPTIIRMVDLSMEDMWATRPRVADWLARVEARPSFAEAYYPGTRIDPGAWPAPGAGTAATEAAQA